MLRFLMVLVGLVFANLAMAVPAMMNYQGQLFLNGSPAAGPVSVTFRLYDAQTGGTLLWTETDVVQVQNGLFSTILGDGTTLPYLPFSGQTLWLEMEVSGTTLSPRTQFVSTPYAYRSQRADTADVALSGTTGNELWSTDGTNVWRGSGNVGIGTASPTSKLHLDAGEWPGTTSLLRLSRGASYGWTSFSQHYGSVADAGLRIGTAAGLDAVTILNGNGFVGIGTTAPSGRLFVKQHSDIANPNQTAFDVLAGVTDVSPKHFRIETKSGDPWNIHLTHEGSAFITGNVGIGTAVPRTRLEVTTTADGIATSGSGAIGGFRLRGATFYNTVLDMGIGANGVGNNTWLQATDATDLSQRYILSLNPNGGNVGIGTTNPTSKLHVVGDFCATGVKNRLVHDEKFGDLYYNATESANALFSLEGESRLKDGRCGIQLDPKWLAGVTIDERHPMQVWITFYGQHSEYYVERGKTGFTLIDHSGSNASFGWKVEARQKGYENVYLNRVSPTAAK